MAPDEKDGKPPEAEEQPAEAEAEEEEAAEPAKPALPRYVVIGATVAVVLLVGGVLGSLFWPRYEKPDLEVETAPAAQPQGPRSILDGTVGLQAASLRETGGFSEDLAALVAAYGKSPDVVSEGAAAAITRSVAESNLFVRIAPEEYEVALRKAPGQWLLCTWDKVLGQRIKPVPGGAEPPFTLKARAPTPAAPAPTRAAETAAAKPAAVPPTTAAAPTPAAPEAVATAEPAAQAPAPAAPAPEPAKAGPVIQVREAVETVRQAVIDDWQRARMLLKSGGNMKSGDGFIAIVNGKVVKTGDRVTVNLGANTYEFLVKSIDGRVVKYTPLRGPEGPAPEQLKDMTF